MIYLKLALSLFIIYTIGALTLSFLSKKHKEILHLVAFPVGYIVISILFLKLREVNISSSNSITILFAVLISLMSLSIIRNKLFLTHYFLYLFRSLFKKRIIFIVLALLALSTWQYYAIGESNYFHSSNEDFYDGVVGGNQFRNLPYDKIVTDFKNNIPLQYSTIGLYEQVYDFKGINSFLHNAILNLIITLLGCYFLCFYVFKFSNIFSLSTSFFCVSSTFYFHTFLAGHIGSLMYGSIAPFYLGLFLLIINKKLPAKHSLLLILIFYFLKNTYGTAQYLLIGVMATYSLFQLIYLTKLKHILFFRNKLLSYKKLIIFSSTCLFITLCISIIKWYEWEPVRFTNYLTSNSWKISKNKEMVAIFWGLFNPNIAGGISLIPYLLELPSVSIFIYSISIVLTLLFIFSAYQAIKRKAYRFLSFFAIMFPCMVFLVIYFWGSTYYTYKVLYINYFLIVILISSSHIHIKNNLKRLSLIFFLLVGFINLFWSFFLTVDIYHRPYHKIDYIKEATQFCKDHNIKNLEILIPPENDFLAFKSILEQENIQTYDNFKDSQTYILSYNFSKPIFDLQAFKYNLIFQNDFLSIHERPNTFSVDVNGTYIPQRTEDSYIYWEKNDLTSIDSQVKNINNFLKTFAHDYPKHKLLIDVNNEIAYNTILESIDSLQINIGSVYDSSFVISLNTSYQFDFLEFKFNSKNYSSFFNTNHYGEVVAVNPILTIRKFNPDKLSQSDTGTKFENLISDLSKNSGLKEFVLSKKMPKDIQLLFKQVIKSKGQNISTTPNYDCIYIAHFTKIPTNNKKIDILGNIKFANFDIVAFKLKTKEQPIPSNFEASTYQINIQNTTNETKYLNLYFGNGPSIDFEDQTVHISNSINTNTITKHIKSDVGLVSIPILLNKSSVTYRILVQHKSPHSILPYNEEMLSSFLGHVGITDEMEVEQNNSILSKMQKLVNNTRSYKFTLENFRNIVFSHILNGEFIKIEDIVNTEDIELNNNWHQIEYDKSFFRWTNNYCSFFIKNKKSGLLTLDIDSFNSTKKNIYMIINNSLTNYVFKLTGRKTTTINLNQFKEFTGNNDQITFFSDTKPIEEGLNGRKLYFRFFNISIR